MTVRSRTAALRSKSERGEPLPGTGSGREGASSNYQFMRLVLELFSSVGEALAGLMPNRFDEAIVFLIVARTSLSDWVNETEIRPPSAAGRAITAYGIAASFARSPETTRRYARWLVDQDYLATSERGVVLSTSPANVTRIVSFYAVCHDLFVRLIADGVAADALVSRPAESERCNVREMLSRALDVMLLPFGPDTTGMNDPVSLAIWCVIATINVRQVTSSPTLATHFVDVPVPDELRRPVAIGAMARALRIPYATAWRKAQALIATGVLQHQPGGLIVPLRALEADAVLQPLTRTITYTLRKVRELERLGYSASAITNCYIGARPQELDLNSRRRTAG